MAITYYNGGSYALAAIACFAIGEATATIFYLSYSGTWTALLSQQTTCISDPACRQDKTSGPPADNVLQEHWFRAKAGAISGKFQKFEKLCLVCFLGIWSTKEHCRSCHSPLPGAYTGFPGQWPPLGVPLPTLQDMGQRSSLSCVGCHSGSSAVPNALSTPASHGATGAPASTSPIPPATTASTFSRSKTRFPSWRSGSQTATRRFLGTTADRAYRSLELVGFPLAVQCSIRAGSESLLLLEFSSMQALSLPSVESHSLGSGSRAVFASMRTNHRRTILYSLFLIDWRG